MTSIVITAESPSMMTRQQLYGAACGTYHIAFDDLVARIAERAFDSPKAFQEAFDGLNIVEKGLAASLKEWLGEHKHGKLVQQYIYACSTFANYMAEAASLHEAHPEAKIDPFGPKLRRNTKKHFDVWKAAEMAYARAGFTTIPFDNWLLPIVDKGNLYSSVFTMLMIERKPGEEQKLYAVEMQRKNPKLKI